MFSFSVLVSAVSAQQTPLFQQYLICSSHEMILKKLINISSFLFFSFFLPFFSVMSSIPKPEEEHSFQIILDRLFRWVQVTSPPKALCKFLALPAARAGFRWFLCCMENIIFNLHIVFSSHFLKSGGFLLREFSSKSLFPVAYGLNLVTILTLCFWQGQCVKPLNEHSLLG